MLIMENPLEINFNYFDNDWDALQTFLDNKGNPPYIITTNLNLKKKKVNSFFRLLGVEKNLNLELSNIKSLGHLIYVKGDLNLESSNIQTLSNLEYVLGSIDLSSTFIEDLGHLKFVGNNLDLRDCKFLNPQIDEIRRKVKVMGKILIDY